ncbi:MAG: glucokinase [Clostridiales bacterium 43-6]|nr:MAG: glucokinase [Clostridiales bacterium 43-6]
MYYAGIDLGGTNIATAIVNDNYEILGRGKLKTNMPRSAESIADDMAKTVRMACEDAGIDIAKVKSVGVGTPGSFNQETGIIEFSNNLKFNNVPMVQLIEDRLGIRCYMENDANAAAYGEQLAGAGKGSKNFIAITLGTGVGGGIIINGKIYSGSNYCGAELGHSVISIGGVPCSCGRKGCYESYASATALIRQTKEKMEETKDSIMWELAGGEINGVNGRIAFDAMRQGDRAGKEVVDRYIEYVGCGLVDIINTFQPDFVCIGGGIGNEGEYLLAPLREYVEKERYSKYAKKQTELCKALLGSDAGIIGAAMLYRLHA